MVQRPTWKHPLRKLRGEVTIVLTVFDGRKKRYVPVDPSDIKAIDIYE